MELYKIYSDIEKNADVSYIKFNDIINPIIIENLKKYGIFFMVSLNYYIIDIEHIHIKGAGGNRMFDVYKEILLILIRNDKINLLL